LFGDDGDDFGYDFLITDDGYVLLGTATSDEGDLDILLVKTDKQGNAQSGFPKTIDIGGNEEGYALEVSDEFGYVVLGYADDHPKATDFGDPRREVDKDLLFVLTQENGDTVVTRIHGPKRDDEGRCIVRIDNGYLLLGNSSSYTVDGNSDIFLVKTDPYGYAIGNTTTGTSSYEKGECLKMMPDGTGILSGTSTNSTGGQPRIFLAEINTELEVNRINVSAAGNFTGKSVEINSDGNYILVGTITLTDQNIYAMGVDPSGGQAFYTTYGRTGEQSASCFRITPDGGLVILGNNSFEGNSMITLIKTGPEGSME